MKINKLLILLGLPFLVSCTTVPTYNGIKVKLPYDENGGLYEVTPNELYEYLIEGSNSGVVLLSDKTCSSCAEATEQIDGYSKLENFKSYKIELNGISIDDYNVLVSITSYVDNLYALPEFGETIYLPTAYLFMGVEDGSAVAKTTNNNFIDFLRMYVEVIN